MNEQWMNPQSISAEQVEEIQRSFVLKVYSWMMAGLMVTGIMALFTVNFDPLLQFVVTFRFGMLGLVAVQLGLVVWLSARVEKMSATTATMIFLGYSALTGVTLSVLFIIYTAASLATAFFTTAGMFGVMSAYGYMTKRDLTGLGTFLMMGLVGLVIASIVNMFLQNSTVYWITSYIGIFIFVGLTAFDAQKIKAMSQLSLQGGEAEQKGAIIGALRLYLDFINLFLLLLRVMGNRR